MLDELFDKHKELHIPDDIPFTWEEHCKPVDQESDTPHTDAVIAAGTSRVGEDTVATPRVVVDDFGATVDEKSDDEDDDGSVREGEEGCEIGGDANTEVEAEEEEVGTPIQCVLTSSISLTIYPAECLFP